MSRNRFFRRVWQFNALAIAGVSVLGLVLGSYGVFETVRHVLRDRSIHAAARVPVEDAGEANEAESPREIISVGHFSKLHGADVLWAPVTGNQRYRFNVYSKSADSVRNYAFYNPQTGESRRLLGTDRTVISSARPLVAEKAGSVPEAIAIIYEIIRKDTDGDGVLTERDQRDLVISRPDGSSAVQAVSGADVLHGASLAGSETVVVIYGRKGTMVAEHFAVADLKSVKRVPLN